MNDGDEIRSRLAYRDEAFFDGDEGRPLRILAEYLRPLAVFRRQRIRDTIAPSRDR